jgi:hypothetical protein
MLAFDAKRTPDSSSRPAENLVAAQVTEVHEPAVVHNCSRLGRSANPPGFSFSDWLRDRRSR